MQDLLNQIASLKREVLRAQRKSEHFRHLEKTSADADEIARAHRFAKYWQETANELAVDVDWIYLTVETQTEKEA